MDEEKILTDVINDQDKLIEKQKCKISNLNIKLTKTERKANWEKHKRLWENLWTSAVVGITILLVMLGLSYITYQNLTTESIQTHCYIHYEDTWKSKDYQLKGSIPWHEDTSYGYFRTLEEAISISKTLGCKLQSE